MEKLNKLLKDIKALPLKILVGSARGLVKVIKPIMQSSAFMVAMAFVLIAFGFAVGARMFETGRASSFSSLKGSNVKLSGACRTDGQVRKPSLAEDEVKIVSINSKTIVGVIRATRETVECDLETTAIDVLPLLKDFAKTPREIPEIKPFEINQVDTELISLKGKTIRASGICDIKSGGQTEAFIDQDIEVINVGRSETDSSLLLIAGIMKKTKVSVNCDSHGIKYNILATTIGNSEGLPVEVKKDIVGETILVTSNCFPDHRLPPSKKNKSVYYPLIDARVKVVQATFDDAGKLAYLAGAVIENGALVECDTSRYPINWKHYDDRIKLAPIKGSVETTIEEQVERSAPSDIEETK